MSNRDQRIDTDRRPLTAAVWHQRSPTCIGGAAAFWLLPLLLLLQCLVGSVGWAAAPRPLEGGGNFRSLADMVNRWRDNGTLDVILMFAVANGELTYRGEHGVISAEVGVTAAVTSSAGEQITRTRTIVLQVANADEAKSSTLYQIFSVVLPNVPFRDGYVSYRLEDMNRGRSGLLNLINENKAHSEAAADWSAPTTRRQERGLTLGDPLFLSGAPIGQWRQGELRPDDAERSVLFDYVSPTRRYGLARDHLQIYFEVQPPRQGSAYVAADTPLMVQISGRDPDFALRDTLRLDDVARLALVSGNGAGVFYELDINVLPPGSFQLLVAPLADVGRGFVTEFDVTWRMAVLGRHGDDLLGEGRTVFYGKRLKEFLAASGSDREVMLERFWRKLDPDPETPVNEVYLEFRRRVTYVRKHLGGFGRSGANDPRGEIYLLLGPADKIEIESMPLNPMDQEDARIKVFELFAPDRVGQTAKGTDPAGTQELSPYSRVGGIPMPYSPTAEKNILVTRGQASRYLGFELWRYQNAGVELFENEYSRMSLGLSFLFVDKTGTGYFVLESTNAFQLGQ